ncbi:uncharacterized protein L201_006932 [Kwoniella dendrophila CBS 6074]|uniref:Peroxin-5 n=1 Tax=Kwoniella dendrophila CBS 6074 TaxID=1295534 RepID=A0AAX4K5F3_9TREE
MSSIAADCGPSNVLKNVQGRLDRDHSLQQDRLVSTPNIAGSSKQPFRPTQQVTTPQSSNFRNTQSAQTPFDLISLHQHLPSPPHPRQQDVVRPGFQQSWADAFGHTQAGSSKVHHAPYNSGTSAGWGNEFAQQSATAPRELNRTISPPQPMIAPWKRPLSQQPSYQPSYHSQIPTYPQYLPHQESISSQTNTQQIPSTSNEPLTQAQDVLAKTAQSFVDQLEGDSNILKDNLKLAESKFMSLLKGLGNGGVVIDEGEQAIGEEVGEGARLVDRVSSKVNGENGWADAFMVDQSGSDAKGKSRVYQDQVMESPAPYSNLGYRHGMIPSLDPYATPPNFQTGKRTQILNDSSWEASFQDQEALIRSSENNSQSQSRKSVHFDQDEAQFDPTMSDNVYERGKEKSGVPNNLEEALRHSTSIPGLGVNWAEEGLLDDFDDEVFMGFNGVMKQAENPSNPQQTISQQQVWDRLHEDWEEFKSSTNDESRTFKGMGLGDQTERYLFQNKNPYFGISEFGSYWEQESPTLKGVLELEAAVQNSPSSFEAWYNLGLKQQENEREESAILALSKVIQLEPNYKPTYLALAVSYTNENDSEAACTMLEKWIALNETQNTSVNISSQKDDEEVDKAKKVWNKIDRENLIERLINIARQNPEEVDAEVQVALGVLFNGTEEYQKAEDCFLSALSVKPDDWLMYNRLGATLANSGRSNEAIKYYHKALELHPNFVRALFNLGISYMNLGQYPLAAQSALDALRLQHSDISEGYSFLQQNVSGAEHRNSKGVTSEALWNTLKSACVNMNRHDLVKLVEGRELSDFPMNFGDGSHP